MSDTTNTLSDLLSAARTEPTQEFVSVSDAERLVAHRFMRDVPSMKQTVTRRLLSTPLRLSITAMTSAALITIGTLAVRSFIGTSDAPVISKLQIAQMQHQQPHAKIVVVDSSGKHSATPRESTIDAVPETPAVPAIPTVPAV